MVTNGYPVSPAESNRSSWMDLYSRIFKYAPRSDQKAIENFLTECLCDLLERMTALGRKCLERFIFELLVGSHSPSGFQNRLSSAASLRWETQKSIHYAGGRGCLDLCLLADGQVILVIENKVAAGFTYHRVSDDLDEPHDDLDDYNCSQLKFYEGYLAENSPGAGLVLLTHFTAAPQTFLVENDDNKHGGTARIFRRVCRWSDAYNWISQSQLLSKKGCDSNPRENLLGLLLSEFLQFLEGERMNLTETNNDDLELMQTFFVHNLPRKMRDLMASARNSVVALPAVANAGQYGKARAFQDKQNPLVWDWVYCFEQNLKWFISWGLSGKDGLRAYKIEFDSPLTCFVLISTDGREIPASSAQLQSCKGIGWSVYEPSSGQKLRLVKTAEPVLLLEANAGFNRPFERWVTEAVEEGVALLGSARESIK